MASVSQLRLLGQVLSLLIRQEIDQDIEQHQKAKNLLPYSALLPVQRGRASLNNIFFLSIKNQGLSLEIAECYLPHHHAGCMFGLINSACRIAQSLLGQTRS